MMQVYKFVRPYWNNPGGLAFSSTRKTVPLSVLSVMVLILLTACSTNDHAVEYVASEEKPGIVVHANNQDLIDGNISLEDLLAIGEQIFKASFNTLDGAGNSKTRLLTDQDEISKINSRFNRISGPDANSCVGCHNLPTIGGGGDNVTNVFVLAHEFPNANFDKGPGDLYEEHSLIEIGNERATISMFGSGLIELLAREMTRDLLAIRDSAKEQAIKEDRPITLPAITKGVSFGEITAWPDGLIDNSGIQGVDEDLIVRPFSQKGVYTSLREFTLDSFNLHHGLQAEERAGSEIDADRDGVINELTIADTTAVVLFQAKLDAPYFLEPRDNNNKKQVELGNTLFSSIGCAVCHKPYLELESPIYREPNPFNPAGTLSDYPIPTMYDINLAKGSKTNAIEETSSGTFLVYAYTDLKRHNMGPILANEQREQRFVDPAYWITKKLWGMMSEPPFTHHGKATLLEEAIEMHMGEANDSRLNYERLSDTDRAAIIAFLSTFGPK